MLPKLTRQYAALCILSLCWISVSGQGITTPRTPSPAAKVIQTIGISTVEVSYSRPSVREREIWGKQVPFGWNVQGFGNGASAPWRAGANENTTIQFSHPVKVEGREVPAGTYGLFYIINADNTGEVILSKDSRSWGSFFYVADHDQLRSKIQVKETPFCEMLTYEFSNLTKNSAELDLKWEKRLFPIKIEFAVDEIVMNNAQEELKGPVGFNWQGFASAANYAAQNKINLEQAMIWADQAVVQNPGFTTQNVKANVLRAMGKNAEAEKLINDNLANATEAEINNYGYTLLGQSKFDKAVEVFLLNTQKFPKSANAWDSLGEGYVNKGDKKNAIASFKKSISLNPPPNVKANSEKFLQQLGAL